jgi:3-oxoacyl-[acyl-carrier protein] reductase
MAPRHQRHEGYVSTSAGFGKSRFEILSPRRAARHSSDCQQAVAPTASRRLRMSLGFVRQQHGERNVDLGIKGRRALVCASSKGLGRACAMALAREGVHVTLTARGAEALAATAAEIRLAAPDVEVIEVAGDITTPEGRAAALQACPDPDILINNAGGPSPGDFRNWTRDDWVKALDANMLTPIELIKATVDGMIGRKFGRIVNITSAAVKAPIDVLGLSNGARTGLTGFVAGIARKTVRHNVTINGLLPGPFDTDRLRGVAAAQAKAAGKSLDEITKQRMSENPAGRFGQPDEFGFACAFLCGAQAGFITGQNLLLDGGAFPGTL